MVRESPPLEDQFLHARALSSEQSSVLAKTKHDEFLVGMTGVGATNTTTKLPPDRPSEQSCHARARSYVYIMAIWTCSRRWRARTSSGTATKPPPMPQRTVFASSRPEKLFSILWPATRTPARRKRHGRHASA